MNHYPVSCLYFVCVCVYCTFVSVCWHMLEKKTPWKQTFSSNIIAGIFHSEVDIGFWWSWGQQTHLAHGPWCSLNKNKPTTRSGTDLLFSSHGLPKCLLWAGYKGGLSKALYANELLINYLLNFPSQGGRRLEHCSMAPRPLSGCLLSIKARLPGDWFRRLAELQANAKIIYLSWGAWMGARGNRSHP